MREESYIAVGVGAIKNSINISRRNFCADCNNLWNVRFIISAHKTVLALRSCGLPACHQTSPSKRRGQHERELLFIIASKEKEREVLS
jgi:hypothetical protein